MNQLRCLLAVALFLFASKVSAGCDFDSTDPHCLCNEPVLSSSTLLPVVHQEAVRVRMRFCVHAGSQEEVFWALESMVRNTANWMDPFGGFGHGHNLNQMALARALGDREFPSLDRPHKGPVFVEFNTEFRPSDITQCNTYASSLQSGKTCEDVFMEFHRLYSYAQRTFPIFTEVTSLVALTELATIWDDFLRHSRGQTPLELWANSKIYQRHRTEQFSPPPAYQLILLHPTLVIEHLPAADKGSRTDAGLAIEVIGRNGWRQRAWYHPTGWAVVTTYVDRPDVNGWGYGAVIHFGNAYSIGATARSGDVGFFASLDFVKLFQDRFTVADRYINR